MTPDGAPNWLGLAEAQRRHFQSTRDMQWKLHLGVWALLVVILYMAYTRDVMQPVPCAACYFLQALIGIDVIWNLRVMHVLEVSRAAWNEYESQAAGKPREFLVSVLRLRCVFGVLLPSAVTGMLAVSACYVLSSPPIRGL